MSHKVSSVIAAQYIVQACLSMAYSCAVRMCAAQYHGVLRVRVVRYSTAQYGTVTLLFACLSLLSKPDGWIQSSSLALVQHPCKTSLHDHCLHPSCKGMQGAV